MSQEAVNLAPNKHSTSPFDEALSCVSKMSSTFTSCITGTLRVIFDFYLWEKSLTRDHYLLLLCSHWSESSVWQSQVLYWSLDWFSIAWMSRNNHVLIHSCIEPNTKQQPLFRFVLCFCFLPFDTPSSMYTNHLLSFTSRAFILHIEQYYTICSMKAPLPSVSM